MSWLNLFGLIFVVLLAFIPGCVFLLSGATMGHFLLIVFAIIFLIGHIYVTKMNTENY